MGVDKFVGTLPLKKKSKTHNFHLKKVETDKSRNK